MESIEPLINNFRHDGRKPQEIRSPDIEVGIVKDSTGSCLFSSGETKVLSWIMGPKESVRTKTLDNKGSLKCNFTISSFANSNRKSEYKRNLQMREFSSTLKEIFEESIIMRNYIKSEIEINVVLLQNDGSYKSAAISSVTLALINAGILLKDTIVGTSVGIIKEDVFICDMTKEEENLKTPILNCAYMPFQKKFIFLEISNSTVDYKYSEDLMKFAEKSGELMFNYIKDFLKNNYLA